MAAEILFALASLKDEYIKETGFQDVKIIDKTHFPVDLYG